uniref:Uncharacterized protein n=1 Tax=Lactuca sativa TaxID=4236 RepID=A0A9R1XW25_LACSA|nr:hypothetical protein LSAT_V11C200075140 [Lactuca sativa]
MEMLNIEQLDISCILWYQIMLHSLMLISRIDIKYVFINPQYITSKRYEYDDRGETNHVVNDLVDVMNFHQEKQFFLAPDWERAITWFKNTKTNISRLCPMTWNLPKCGYYVMNWMHEFVLFDNMDFRKTFGRTKEPFSSEELDECVTTWMRTFGDKVKPFSNNIDFKIYGCGCASLGCHVMETAWAVENMTLEGIR